MREERGVKMFGNRVLRAVFGPERGEVTGEWRKLHKEELSDLYSSPNIFRMIESKKVRGARHAARMEVEEVNTGFWWGNLRERTTWKAQV